MADYTPIRPSSFHSCPKFIVTIFVLISCTLHPIAAANVPNANLNFVKNKCSTTTYPSLCYKTLSPYAAAVKTSSLKLCYAALAVTIKSAQATSAMVSTLAKQKGLTRAEAAVIRDCIENIQDSVDQLQQTLRAMANLRGADRQFQLSNAKTWASAAITDENTCMDGFSGRKVSVVVKNKVRNSIVAVTRLNSNALSLINRIK